MITLFNHANTRLLLPTKCNVNCGIFAFEFSNSLLFISQIQMSVWLQLFQLEVKFINLPLDCYNSNNNCSIAPSYKDDFSRDNKERYALYVRANVRHVSEA